MYGINFLIYLLTKMFKQDFMPLNQNMRSKLKKTQQFCGQINVELERIANSFRLNNIRPNIQKGMRTRISTQSCRPIYNPSSSIGTQIQLAIRYSDE